MVTDVVHGVGREEDGSRDQAVTGPLHTQHHSKGRVDLWPLNASTETAHKRSPAAK